MAQSNKGSYEVCKTPIKAQLSIVTEEEAISARNKLSQISHYRR